MSVVLRIARRRTTWEGEDVDLILATEFALKSGGVDLRPSVYVLEHEKDAPAEAVQAHAEHAASFLRSPPKGAMNVDMAGLTNVAPTQDGPPSDAKFVHARNIHHELVFDSEDDLRATLQRLLAAMKAREYPVSRPDLLDYANGRLDALDSEWIAALSEEPARGWERQLVKRRAQLERETQG